MFVRLEVGKVLDSELSHTFIKAVVNNIECDDLNNVSGTVIELHPAPTCRLWIRQFKRIDSQTFIAGGGIHDVNFVLDGCDALPDYVPLLESAFYSLEIRPLIDYILENGDRYFLPTDDYRSSMWPKVRPLLERFAEFAAKGG